MATLLQPLRDEHTELLPHIDALRTAGDAVGVVPVDELRTRVDDALAFLVGHLIPHATAEDKALYPEVERLMGAPGATAAMSRDHLEVDRLTHALRDLRASLDGPLEPTLANDLRRVLYGLYALVRVHFAKEEEIYVPILEAGLTAPEADALFQRMHAAAHAH